MRPLRLGMQLGLFQLSLGILGVLILGLLNRLLIQDIQLPAVLAALAVGAQQLMGFTRAVRPSLRWHPSQPATAHTFHRDQLLGDRPVVRRCLSAGAPVGRQHGGLRR